MKAIIAKKLYDTDTAKEIAERWNGRGTSDWGYLREVLYQNKNGEFFLHGDGGPMTEYREECGNRMYCGSEKIIPFTVEEAKDWVEEYSNADTYIELFGDVEE